MDVVEPWDRSSLVHAHKYSVVVVLALKNHPSLENFQREMDVVEPWDRGQVSG